MFLYIIFHTCVWHGVKYERYEEGEREINKRNDFFIVVYLRELWCGRNGRNEERKKRKERECIPCFSVLVATIVTY